MLKEKEITGLNSWGLSAKINGFKILVGLQITKIKVKVVYIGRKRGTRRRRGGGGGGGGGEGEGGGEGGKGVRGGGRGGRGGGGGGGGGGRILEGNNEGKTGGGGGGGGGGRKRKRRWRIKILLRGGESKDSSANCVCKHFQKGIAQPFPPPSPLPPSSLSSFPLLLSSHSFPLLPLQGLPSPPASRQ